MKPFFSFLVITVTAYSICAAGNLPFSRGVNLTTWFQESNARQIQFSKYSKTDFENIQSLGCDVIRLPINMHSMTKGAPDFLVDPLLFDFLDRAVDWAEELGIHLILDNHSFDAVNVTSPAIGDTLIPIWRQYAEHFKNRSALISYEVLNEPHNITTAQWGTIQQQAINAIRAIDSIHTIIVGPANWNSYNDLASLPVYGDTNVIYTFHFYDPFIFTHQGAGWSSPSLEPLAGVPFPYDAARMPSCPPSLAGTWIQSEMNNYSSSGTAAHVKSLINIAVAFKNNRNVPLFCGEFGVYIPNSNNGDRVSWYDTVRTYLEQKGIAWTTWDYQGGFGLFEKGTDELFEYDLNTPLLTALGFAVPPQQDFMIVPDSTEFSLYDDFIGSKILTLTYSAGDSLDFYSLDSPEAGKYCIQWGSAAQYQYIAFKFAPIRDFSYLVSGMYSLDFWVRSSRADMQFYLRFIDTKADAADHPWRMVNVINSSDVSWDGAWHHMRIRLTDFTEQGSWDNNSWFTPVGAFDWKAIDRFDIVAEEKSIAGTVWFDNIHIAAAPLSAGPLKEMKPETFRLFQNFPNPFNPSTTIRYQLPHSSHITIQIFDVLGQMVGTIIDENKEAGDYTVQWNAQCAGGVYFCRLQADNLVLTNKLLLLK